MDFRKHLTRKFDKHLEALLRELTVLSRPSFGIRLNVSLSDKVASDNNDIIAIIELRQEIFLENLRRFYFEVTNTTM